MRWGIFGVWVRTTGLEASGGAMASEAKDRSLEEQLTLNQLVFI